MSMAATEPRSVMESPGWALQQLATYEDAARTFHGASDAAFEAKAEVTRIKAQLKEIEAEVIANGVNGKNAEERAANALLEMRNMPGYQSVMNGLRAAERQAAQAEYEADEAANTMRAASLALQYASAYLNRVAAAEGRAGMEEGATNGYHN